MLTITTAAAEVIREFVRRSDVRNPAVYLGLVSIPPSARRLLYPLVYPRSRYLWLTTTIKGFPFVTFFFYPRHVRQALRHGVLDTADRGLVLKDSNGGVVLPKQADGAL